LVADKQEEEEEEGLKEEGRMEKPTTVCCNSKHVATDQKERRMMIVVAFPSNYGAFESFLQSGSTLKYSAILEHSLLVCCQQDLDLPVTLWHHFRTEEKEIRI